MGGTVLRVFVHNGDHGAILGSRCRRCLTIANQPGVRVPGVRASKHSQQRTHDLGVHMRKLFDRILSLVRNRRQDKYAGLLPTGETL